MQPEKLASISKYYFTAKEILPRLENNTFLTWTTTQKNRPERTGFVSLFCTSYLYNHSQ